MNENNSKINASLFQCWVCESAIEPFMTFGRMPIANNFLSEKEFNDEYFFEMEPAFCNTCKTFQLVRQPEPQQMFNENYAFFSGTSEFMAKHFEAFSNKVLNYLDEDPFVVEIGSNDGIMLRNFANKNIKHLGVEPSSNVAMVAKEKGINTTINFFDKDLAQKIVKGYGQASAFIAANVMCHIPYIKSIVEGIEVLLRPNGVVVFEEPYLGEVIDKTTYDQIYDEHTFLFSAHSVKYLFGQYGMELINLEPQTTHGGSMRYTIAKKGARTVNKIVCDILENEEDQGLNDPKTYLQFKQNCEHYRIQLVNLLEQIRKKGKSISGYAATSKSTTITNYCEITSDLIDCIYDSTPIKQGKFNPGTHIPIRPHQEFNENYPDYAVLFGYNHSKEIFAKEHDFIEQGGKWIVYVPQIEII